MRLYEVRTTEYNSQQEYSYSHLLAAENLHHARQLARNYFQNWYQDGRKNHAREDNPDSFEFVDGNIILKIKAVCEITLGDWLDKQIELYRIGKLPQAKAMCKKCSRLLQTCEYILQCLDVGGEQSRQFANEITYLKKTVRETKSFKK